MYKGEGPHASPHYSCPQSQEWWPPWTPSCPPAGNGCPPSPHAGREARSSLSSYLWLRHISRMQSASHQIQSASNSGTVLSIVSDLKGGGHCRITSRTGACESIRGSVSCRYRRLTSYEVSIVSGSVSIVSGTVSIPCQMWPSGSWATTDVHSPGSAGDGFPCNSFSLAFVNMACGCIPVNSIGGWSENEKITSGFFSNCKNTNWVLFQTQKYQVNSLQNAEIPSGLFKKLEKRDVGCIYTGLLQINPHPKF